MTLGMPRAQAAGVVGALAVDRLGVGAANLAVGGLERLHAGVVGIDQGRQHGDTALGGQPVNPNFELLRHNTEFYPNITCLKKALWSGPANLSIANPTAESMSFRVSPSAQGDKEGILAVGVKDLAEMFEGSRIDLLKIDIEGAEKEVFQHGMNQWIDQVDTIAVELHDRFQPGCHKALVDSLKDRSHRMYKLGEYTIINLIP